MDADDNILVVDSDNDRIQKFTSDGNFITSVDKHIVNPRGIGIHPRTRKVYVAKPHSYSQPRPDILQQVWQQRQ